MDESAAASHRAPRSARPLAVLLAAGLGSRLGDVPKALFEVAGATLVDRCVDALVADGFDRLLIVTGHRAGAVRAHVRSRRYALETRFLHNERYADLNNFHTVRLACERAASGRLLVLNSDIVFTDAVLREARRAAGELVLCVEPASVDDEALKVALAEDGRVAQLGKGIPSASAFGEFIGISALGEAARRRYVHVSRAALAAGETALYYEDVYSRLCSTVDARVVPVEAGQWAEIDTAQDVPAAELVARGPSSASRARRFRPNAVDRRP